MPIPMQSDVDFNHNTVSQARMNPVSSAPSSPQDGEIYTNTTGNHMYARLNGAWSQLDNQTSDKADFMDGRLLVDLNYKEVDLSASYNVSSIYWKPLKSGMATLYDGTSWNHYDIPNGLSVSVPSTIFRGFDIFMMLSSGTPTLVTNNWTAPTTGTITGISIASSAVFTSNAHTLSVGDPVGFSGITGSGMPNNKISIVTATTTNTFTCAGIVTTGGTYTSGGTWYKLINGRPSSGIITTNELSTEYSRLFLKGTAGTYRYLGSGFTCGTSGTVDFTPSRRALWNYYPQGQPITAIAQSVTGTYTYGTNTWRQAKSRSDAQVEILTGVNAVGFAYGQKIDINTYQHVRISNGPTNSVDIINGGIGINSVTTDSSTITGMAAGPASSFGGVTMNAKYRGQQFGFNIYTCLEKAASVGASNAYTFHTGDQTYITADYLG